VSGGRLLENVENAVRVAAIGVYVPPRRESNFELLAGFGVDEEFLRHRIGVVSRSVKEENERASDLCLKAFSDLQLPGVDLSQIQIVCVVTQNPDRNIPHVSAVLHEKLGLPSSCMTFDLSQGCAGFTHGVTILSALMDRMHFDHALLFTCDPYSQIVDKRDKNTALLFGDGAAVSYLSRTGTGYTVVDADFGTVPGSSSCLRCDEGRLYMNGRQVFVNASREVPPSVLRVLDRNGLTLADVDQFLFHPGSRHMIEALKKNLQLDGERVPFETVEFGNTVSSSIPIMLKRRLERPDHRQLVLCGFGVGFTWGTCLVRLIS